MNGEWIVKDAEFRGYMRARMEDIVKKIDKLEKQDSEFRSKLKNHMIHEGKKMMAIKQVLHKNTETIKGLNTKVISHASTKGGFLGTIAGFVGGVLGGMFKGQI